MEAIQKKDYVGYLLDFFLENSPEEQKLWIAEHQSEIAKLERRVKRLKHCDLSTIPKKSAQNHAP